MSTGIVIAIVSLIVVVFLILLLLFIIRRNYKRKLERAQEAKDKLLSINIDKDIDEVKQLHLIGQSQKLFREWNQKWVDISLNSFSDIETTLFDAEELVRTYHFFKAKDKITTAKTQIALVHQEIDDIKKALVLLVEQEKSNTSRVKYALDLFDDIQATINEHSSTLGDTLLEIEKHMKKVEVEFSEFVMLNDSGDPIEASEVLDRAEEHMVALKHILTRLPDIITTLREVIQDHLADLKEGYQKLLDEGYMFDEASIQVAFDKISDDIKQNEALLNSLELDAVEENNVSIQQEIDELYQVFEAEVEAHQEVVRLKQVIPQYLEHVESTVGVLKSEADRLSVRYVIDGSKENRIKQLAMKTASARELFDKESGDEPESNSYQLARQHLEQVQVHLSDIEEEELTLTDYLNSLTAKHKQAENTTETTLHRLHAIKRHMEKQGFPGIPEEFMALFFKNSEHVETVSDLLHAQQIDMDLVDREISNMAYDLSSLEELTYQIIQNAALTEQLLQYSNRYRVTHQSVQEGFVKSLELYERHRDYEASFKAISEVLEPVEPGVTNRFIQAYQRTEEKI